MATGALDPEQAAALRAERDDLVRRCEVAEQQVAALSAELAASRERLAALEADDGSLSLFAGDPAPEQRVSGDGSDPRILSMILAATAVVAGMVALLALLNGKLMTPFGVVMVLLAIGLGWAAARTRVVPVEVSVVRGIVYVEQGETTYRFDLRKPGTEVEMDGRPGDSGWVVRFPRRNLEPFVIDGSMVDAEEFTRQLREYRPAL
ncbi:hypothetical protein GCM10022237_12600 [Nocardioides ginsengisoli]|uniref:DUF2244 domain-containing protein n=1 Tax=Nocardioides ginsengisoli TaxID=363868 RepID=A0ABW3W3G1_9ACTN